MGTSSFPGAKQPGHGVDLLLPSSTEVKERVELYLYSTFGPLWPVVGQNVHGLGQGTQNFTPSEHMLYSGTVSDGLKRDRMELKQE
jgi:hypothetical protein